MVAAALSNYTIYGHQSDAKFSINDGGDNQRGTEGESSSSNLSPSKQPIPPGWTGAEVTYFGLLHPIYGHNYCTIAELMRSKTCHEVFSYSQQVLGGSFLGQWAGPKRLTSKKKKRNMR